MASDSSDTTRVRRKAAAPRVGSRSGRGYLTILSGEGVGTIIALDKRRIGIGRGENADIRFRDDTISRNHAQLQIDAEGFAKLTDIGSSNGTFLNGVSVRSEVLRDGDRLAFGGDLVVDVRYGRPSGLADAAHRTSELPAMHMSSAPVAEFEHTLENYESQLQLRERIWGTQHPGRAVMLDALGGMLLHRGELEKSSHAYEMALELQKTVVGIHPTEQAQTHFRLARCWMLQGRLRDAQSALEAGHGLLSKDARLRGEAFEYHIVFASILDLQSSSGGEKHLARARELLKDISPMFLSAKQGLINETMHLLSTANAEAKISS